MAFAAFRHFPLTDIHPHALGGDRRRGSRAPRPLLGDAQTALPSPESARRRRLRRYAAELDLDVQQFAQDRADAGVRGGSVGTSSGLASGEVRGTPTLFIDGVVHRGGYDEATLLEALAR